MPFSGYNISLEHIYLSQNKYNFIEIPKELINLKTFEASNNTLYDLIIPK